MKYGSPRPAGACAGESAAHGFVDGSLQRLLRVSSAVVLALCCSVVVAQSDSLAGAAPASTDGMQGDSAATAAEDSPAKNAGAGEFELVNIVPADKKIRATGWGEYRVGGHCLCCDNMKSVDCITVQTTNRTDRLRVKQIVDGKTEADTGDDATYFGDLYERDMPTKPVSLLMVQIVLPKQCDIYKVVVHGIAGNLKRKNVTFNCEVGYTDQFDRLQWAGKVLNSGHEDHIAFDYDRPILTKEIFLKIRDGRNRITEVALFARKKVE